MSEIVSGDSSVFCCLCGKETSIAMLVEHLVREHDFDREELVEGIVNARVLGDSAEERE
jgi:hypothetical protein